MGMNNTPFGFEPSVSPRYAAYLSSYLMDRGVDVEDIFCEAGLNFARNEECIRPIPLSVASRIFELASVRLNDRFFGLNMAQQFHYETSGLLMLALFASPDVETGLKTLIRYDRNVDRGIEPGLVYQPRRAEYTVDLIDLHNKPNVQFNEYLMSHMVHMLQMATRKQVPLLGVCLKHNNSKSQKVLEEYFGVPVKYGQELNKLVFDSAFLTEPFVTAHSMLYEILTKALDTYFSNKGDNSDMMTAVCLEVVRQASVDAPSIESVANSLSLSTRTLKRRLSEEGSSFHDAKKLARENQARYFLGQTNMSLSEIALELGYSELSAFSRAFRTWSGETPQNYRSRVKSERAKG